MIRLTLPWSVLASSNLRNRRRGGKAHSEAYKASRESIAMIAMGEIRGERPAYADGALALRLRFYPPDFRRRDEVNLTKSLMDALNGIAYTDDSQIRDVSILRVDTDPENPRCEVTVSRWLETETEAA